MSASFAAVLVTKDWSHAVDITESTEFSGVDLGGGALGAYGFFITGEGTPGITGYSFDPSFGVCDCTGNGTPGIPVNADPPFPPIWPYPTGLIYSREFFSVNLRMVRENTYIFDVNVVINGNAVDVTGATFTYTAKWDFPDDNADAVFTKTSGVGGGITVLDPVTGSLEIQIDPPDTSALPYAQVDLVYDLTMENISSQIFSILRGVLTVVPNVTELL